MRGLGLKPLANKVWPTFKAFFQEEQQRLNRHTARDSAYANAAMSASNEMFSEATEAFTNLANATIVDRESMLAQNKTIGDITLALATANTQIATLMAQFASLLANGHGR